MKNDTFDVVEQVDWSQANGSGMVSCVQMSI